MSVQNFGANFYAIVTLTGSADPTPNSWESLAWHDDDSQTHSKPQEKNSYEEIFKRPWICEEEWDEDNISDDRSIHIVAPPPLPRFWSLVARAPLK